MDASTSSAAMDASTSSQQQPGEAAEAPLYPYLHVPGVRFVPTDQELLLCYLRSKLRDEPPPTPLVRDADVYAEHPRDLTVRLGPSVGDYWYVFTQRNRKYARGNRPSRSTGDTGRWKSVGKNTAVTYGKEKATIGFKNGLAYEAFVYDDGDSKKKRIEKTEWKMTEFVDVDSNRPISSDSNFMLLNNWVLCKITRKPEKKKGEEDPGASPADEEEEEEGEAEGEGEEEHEPPPMLVDEQLTDTSPDTSQQAQATAPGLLRNGANWSDSTADSQVEGSGSGSGADPRQQPADDDPFASLDLGLLAGVNSFDHAFSFSPDPWAWNLYYQGCTDTDSSGSRLRTPSDPDPMETSSEPPSAPQPRDVVTDLTSSAEHTNVIRKRKEHAKVNGDDAGKKGNAAVKKSSGRAKTGG